MRQGMEKRKKRRKRSEEEENVDRIADNERRVEMWVPKTVTGKKVKDGEIKSLEEMFERNYVMMEPEIFDAVVSNPLEKLVDFKKTTRNAKLSLIRVRKGAGSWESSATTGASLPYKVAGKSASVRVELLPAPEGTGLVVGEAIKDVMRFAGIKDVWSKTSGNTRSKLDFVKAAVDALSNTTKMRISKDIEDKVKRG